MRDQLQAVLKGAWCASAVALVMSSACATYEASVPRGRLQLLAAHAVLDTAGFRERGRTLSLDRFDVTNLAHHLRLYFEEVSTTVASVTMLISGEEFVGDSSGGRVSARGVEWRPVTVHDSAKAAEIRQVGEHVRDAMIVETQRAPDVNHVVGDLERARSGAVERVTPGPIPAKDLGGSRWRVCRVGGTGASGTLVVGLAADPQCPAADSSSHMRYNALVVIRPAAIPVGRRVTTCAAFETDLPRNFVRLEWRPDPTRCPADGADADSSQPNVLIMQRFR